MNSYEDNENEQRALFVREWSKIKTHLDNECQHIEDAGVDIFLNKKLDTNEHVFKSKIQKMIQIIDMLSDDPKQDIQKLVLAVKQVSSELLHEASSVFLIKTVNGKPQFEKSLNELFTLSNNVSKNLEESQSEVKTEYGFYPKQSK